MFKGMPVKFMVSSGARGVCSGTRELHRAKQSGMQTWVIWPVSSRAGSQNCQQTKGPAQASVLLLYMEYVRVQSQHCIHICCPARHDERKQLSEACTMY
jgi:hypothetical protein